VRNSPNPYLWLCLLLTSSPEFSGTLVGFDDYVSKFNSGSPTCLPSPLLTLDRHGP